MNNLKRSHSVGDLQHLEADRQSLSGSSILTIVTEPIECEMMMMGPKRKSSHRLVDRFIRSLQKSIRAIVRCVRHRRKSTTELIPADDEIELQRIGNSREEDLRGTKETVSSPVANFATPQAAQNQTMNIASLVTVDLSIQQQQLDYFPSLLPPPVDTHRKCLVLDLDETLVHSTFQVSLIY